MQKIGDGNIALVAKDFLCWWTPHPGGPETVILVPQGYATDGTSVPGFVPNSIMSAITGITGAVVHDYLYETKMFPKEVCDQIAGEFWEMDEYVSGRIRTTMLAGLDSDIARKIYDPTWEPPEIGGFDDDEIAG